MGIDISFNSPENPLWRDQQEHHNSERSLDEEIRSIAFRFVANSRFRGPAGCPSPIGRLGSLVSSPPFDGDGECAESMDEAVRPFDLSTSPESFDGERFPEMASLLRAIDEGRVDHLIMKPGSPESCRQFIDRITGERYRHKGSRSADLVQSTDFPSAQPEAIGKGASPEQQAFGDPRCQKETVIVDSLVGVHDSRAMAIADNGISRPGSPGSLSEFACCSLGSSKSGGIDSISVESLALASAQPISNRRKRPADEPAGGDFKRNRMTGPLNPLPHGFVQGPIRVFSAPLHHAREFGDFFPSRSSRKRKAIKQIHGDSKRIKLWSQ